MLFVFDPLQEKMECDFNAICAVGNTRNGSEQDNDNDDGGGDNDNYDDYDYHGVSESDEEDDDDDNKWDDNNGKWRYI